MPSDFLSKMLLSSAGIDTKEDLVEALKKNQEYVREIKQEIRLALLENGILQLFAKANKTTVEEETELYKTKVEESLNEAISVAAEKYFKELEGEE